MAKEELEKLIAQGESSTLEFKDGVATPDTIARLIASFANAEGGLILFGVREPNQVVGVEEERLRKAVERAKRHISGEVQTQLDITDFDGHRVGILKNVMEQSKADANVESCNPCAAQQLIQPDASIASLSSLSCSLRLNALCSARVNSGVRWFLVIQAKSALS